LLDTTNEVEMREARRLSDDLVKLALSLGGTCTGEHGVGLGKLKYMADEHGVALDVMRAIKKTLDPDNRMNPGKLIEI